jgi:hypothetical protein
MRWVKGLATMIQFVSEAFIEIFSDTDNYPATGLQPFDGDTWSHWVHLD